MLTIDVFSDIVCPWCLVGNQRLRRVAASLEQPPVIKYHPFFLQAGTPDAGIDIPDMLRRKYGMDPNRMFAVVEAAARESGLELDLKKQRFFYPTVRAHTLLRHAEQRGTQLALVRALFESYFLEARNINDADVLAEIARPHGFSVEDTHALLADGDELEVTRQVASEAARGGIRGVPFHVFNGKVGVSGAQPEAVFRQAIERALA